MGLVVGQVVGKDACIQGSSVAEGTVQRCPMLISREAGRVRDPCAGEVNACQTAASRNWDLHGS